MRADLIAFATSWGTSMLLLPSLHATPPGQPVAAVIDSRWSQALTGHTVGAIVAWVALLVILQAVGWPLTRRILTRLPDRGWAFTRITTLILSGFLVWFFASIHAIAFRAIWCWIALLLVGVAGFFLARRWRVSRTDDALAPALPFIISGELIFWITFAIFVLFRGINPDSYHPYWGGEKPMEFAYMQAILRSSHFPPVDPWYAGGTINYYYYGFYLVAFMVKLVGMPFQYAFNLAEPTFPAMLAAGSFSIATALGRRIVSTNGGAILCGLLGTFFVQFSGNLIDAQRLVHRAVTGTSSTDHWGYWVWSPTRMFPSPELQYSITEFPYFGALYADLHPHVMAMPISFLVLAVGWQLVSLSRDLPMLFVGRSFGDRDIVPFVLPLAVLSIALGSLWMTNAWDLPMFAALAVVAIVMMTVRVPGVLRRLAVVVAITVVMSAATYILILPFNLNYVALFSTIGNVRDQNPLLAIESHVGGQLLLLTVGVAALTLRRSGMRPDVLRLYAGSTVGLLFAVLLVQWAAERGTGSGLRTAEFGVVAVVVSAWVVSAWFAADKDGDFAVPIPAIRLLIIEVALASVVLAALGQPVIGLYVGVGGSAAMLWFALRSPAERFLMAMIAGSALLGAALEVFYLVDNLQTTPSYRMNTIFKFYNQIWNLLGIAAAVLVGRAIWATIVEPNLDTETAGMRSDDRGPTTWSWLTAALAVPVCLAMFAYPVMATPIRLDQQWPGDRRPATLNAYSWMNFASYQYVNPDGSPGATVRFNEDFDAIEWLNNNISGTPVIAEAVFGIYRCNGSRISIGTGLPAPVGWVNHESQQRDAPDLGQREADMRAFYTDVDLQAKKDFLEKYDVEYVIVGQTERHYPENPVTGQCIDKGNPQAIKMIEGMVGTDLEPVWQEGQTTIYRVISN